MWTEKVFLGHFFISMMGEFNDFSQKTAGCACPEAVASSAEAKNT
jgi:hypothetical protein